jgi:hypothetical protein
MEIRNLGDALHHILDAVSGRDLARVGRDLPSENHFAVGRSGVLVGFAFAARHRYHEDPRTARALRRLPAADE